MDSTTLREEVLITAVELAEARGARHYHDVGLVIARGGFDPLAARAALRYWLDYRRDGSNQPVLARYQNDTSSYAISDESRRMVDDIRRSRRAAGTQIRQVVGPVHTGSGHLDVTLTAPTRSEDTAVSFRLDALASRIQQHVNERFDARDPEGMDQGPLLEVVTPGRRRVGHVKLVRRFGGRFVEDPNGTDGIQLRGLDGRVAYVPIADVLDFADVE